MIGTDTIPVLVDRARLVQEIVAALDDTGIFGAMIVGGAGLGKTAVARSVIEQLQWTAPILRVTGGSSLRTIPFGALAPYLHSLPVADAGSPVAVLRAVMGHLAGGATGRPQHPPLLVVDDAHDLDDSSSALLAQLISARRAKVLVMIGDSPAAPPEFRDLSADGLLARFDLQPLDAEAVGTLCSQVLGGPVLTGTSHALAVATGGNPLFLRALLEQGAAEGYLGRLNGIWRLTGEHPMANIRLGDLIRAQLRSRSDGDLEALEVLALAEPIALDDLSRCVDAAALERLRTDDLVAVGTGPGEPVVLRHALYGEVLRSQVPAARSMTIRHMVLALGEPGARSLEGFLRDVSWGLDCGVLPDDGTLLRSASVANGLRDHTFALRAARAVSAPGLRGRALLEIARVQAGRFDFAYAHQLVDEALRGCTDLRLAKDAALLSVELRLKSGALPEDLRGELDRWRSLVATVEQRDLSPAVMKAVLQSRLGCTILDCFVRMMEGRPTGVEEDLRTILAASEGTAETRVASMILLAELLASRGRYAEASANSGEALEIIEAGGAQLLRYRDAAVARHVLVLTSSGRGPEAKEVLKSYSLAHPRSIEYLAGWSDIVDGISALRAARNREARDRFLLALEALRGSDVTQVTTVLVGMAAHASALAGDTARAVGLLEEFEQISVRGSRSMTTTGRLFVTATTVLLGDAPGARASLIEIAGTAVKDQSKEAAVTALRLSLLLGDTSAVEPLITVLGDIEGPEGRYLLEFATAAKERNVDAMVAAATSAGEQGDEAFEFAALSLALHTLNETGPSRRSRAIQRRVVTLGERREGPLSSPLASTVPAASTPRLTPTERKIVALVQEGYSNREIADTKGVSVRTVEGHLYRIFAKLGVSRREDLREP